MLAAATLSAFISVTDLAAAREFYGATLGLTLTDETPFSLIYDANGRPLWVTLFPGLQPQPFTVLGFGVADITATVQAMSAAGITFNRYPEMEQDPDGVWTAPSGTRVAWFEDPDHNVLSLSQSDS